MRRRCWQVELRSQGQSDGMDRLGQMVKFVIDHAAVRFEPERRSPASPARAPQGDAERKHEHEEMTT